MNSKILIADNDIATQQSLGEFLSSKGYDCSMTADTKEAIHFVQSDNFDILIADVKMPKWNGSDILEEIQKYSPRTLTVITTDSATVESAIEALRKGAIDYLIKPLDLEDLHLRLKKIAKIQQVLLENQYLRKEVHSIFNQNIIIGNSPAMKSVYHMIDKVANSSSNILITGKSGTGKELVARSIHQNSPRTNAPFVAINCGAIPETLFESELFGFKKGSFTGATMDKEGVFRAANGGTLFLDEVGEIPIHIQVKLLRAIEEKEIKPIGSASSVHVDARVLSSTNRDLLKEIEEGNFREDLYYRLNIIEIHLPPLSERKEDIPVLVEHFVHKYNQELKRKVLGVDNQTMKILMNYKWKGEVRELENMIERAVLLCETEYISSKDLPPHAVGSETGTDYPDDLKASVHNFEKQHIINILSRVNNDKNKCAEILGIGLSSLYRKIEELEIKI
ncbi:MAG: Fis family transcriptional regulator [Candidatus Marinimicrobia bacterium CG08_land_8_20_14_0_20_45_22]|nr:MAG: Fis family transcriptional regulator [Candidatus Marinimicrobia bacterium CG08_land_8_20_14_0_20_45_22]